MSAERSVGDPPVTFEAWCFATFLGFRSNGCSYSPDTLYFCRIGRGTNDWPPCPCDLHDFRYWLGGSEHDRLCADLELHDGLAAIARRLIWPLSALARRRAATYYAAVRAHGGSHYAYRTESEAERS